MKLTRRNLLTAGMSAAGAVIASPAVLRMTALAADNPILVGNLHDLSGALAASGAPMVLSLQIAVEEINAAGGLLGRPLKIVGYDPQSNIQLYTQYAQELALKDKVAVVHGGITSASREAIRPILDRFKALYFYNTLYEGGVCDRNTFCTGTTPAQTVEKLVPFAMKGSRKKAYIVAADYNYGQITAKWMTKYCRDNGGSVVATDFFPLDVSNFGSTINKIQAAKPDLVMSALVGGNHVAFYRQWAAAGLNGQIPIASTTFGLYNEPQILDQPETEGVMGAYGYFEELAGPANKKFVDTLRGKFKDAPYLNEGACAAYEAIHLWAEGVKKAGSVDRMKVIEALESGVGIAGPSGQVTIDRATHHVVRSAYLAVVQSRKWNVVESYPDQKPLDTAAVCDLVKNPNDKKQYVIQM